MKLIDSIVKIDALERRLAFARLIQRTGSEASYFVGILGYATYTLGADAALIALIMLVFNLATMFGGVVSGVVVDRVGPRRAFLGTQLFIVFCALAIQFIGDSLSLFILLAAGLGICVSASETAFSSFAPYMVSGTGPLKRVNSLLDVASNAAIVIGPAIGAATVTMFPTLRVFLFYGITALTSSVLVFSLSERIVPERPGDSVGYTYGLAALLSQISDGVRVVAKTHSLRSLVLIGMLFWFSFGAFDALESLYYKDVVGVGVEWMGWVNSVTGVGCLLGALALSRTPAKRATAVTLVVALIVVGGGSMLYVGTSWITCVMVGGFILGLGFGYGEPLLRTLIQTESPLSMVGRILSVVRLFRTGCCLLPLAVSPGLASLFGVQAVLFGATALTTLFGFALLREGRSLDLHRARLAAGEVDSAGNTIVSETNL